MSLPKLASTKQGSVFFVVHLAWPWPPAKPLILANDLLDGSLRIEIGNPDCIQASALGHDGTLIWEMQSCPIVAEMGASIILSITWSDFKGHEIHVNGTLVTPTDSHPHFVAKNAPDTGANHFDFSTKNARAITRRKGKHLARPEACRKLGGTDYLLQSLRAEVEQLQDTLPLVKSGRLSHVRGIASRLRLLLLRQGQSPLLQATAAAFDAPLIVFTISNPTLQIPITPSMQIVLGDINGKPTNYTSNPVDIDVWLGFTSIQIGKQVLSHEKVIADLGNTIGSHLDQNIVPSVLVLRSSRTVKADVPTDALVNYIVSVAEAVLILSEEILQKFGKP